MGERIAEGALTARGFLGAASWAWMENRPAGNPAGRKGLPLLAAADSE